jgi:hypothetical protein
MCLGDEKKFVYDPVKKRYVFEGEEDAPEEDKIPPPVASNISRKKQTGSITETQSRKRTTQNSFFVP